MSLARAFTKRSKRHHEGPTSPSDASFRYAAGTIQRSKISLPTEFLSTTNVHALNAPDIPSASGTSSNASVLSADDSDMSSKGSLSTPASSPMSSSADSSPVNPEPGHHRGFFHSSVPKRSATTAASRSSSGTDSSADTPNLPQRAASHSKKAHQDLARTRSASRLTPPPTIMSNATVIRNSAEIFGGAIPSSSSATTSRTTPAATAVTDPKHPFGNELAQVNEVAEEFGGVSALLRAEEREMEMKGLLKYDAEDYVNDILDLWAGAYCDESRLTGLASPWI